MELQMTNPYGYEKHPLIPFEQECTTCSLGESLKEHNHRAMIRGEEPLNWVGGFGPEDLTKVRLIVISDYPGIYEAQKGYPMVEKFDFKPKEIRGKVQPNNAGGFLREALRLMYGLDTYTDVYTTNALKCYPQTTTVLETKHLRPCVKKWLANEFYQLDQYCPKVPVLTLGTQAFRAVKNLYKDVSDTFNDGYIASRRKVHWVGERPVVVSFNPAIAARSEPRIETAVKQTKNGTYIARTERLYPPLPNSPVSRFIDDLRCLAPLV
jgi:uracil-DNA glycosylase